MYSSCKIKPRLSGVFYVKLLKLLLETVKNGRLLLCCSFVLFCGAEWEPSTNVMCSLISISLSLTVPGRSLTPSLISMQKQLSRFDTCFQTQLSFLQWSVFYDKSSATPIWTCISSIQFWESLNRNTYKIIHTAWDEILINLHMHVQQTIKEKNCSRLIINGWMPGLIRFWRSFDKY